MILNKHCCGELTILWQDSCKCKESRRCFLNYPVRWIWQGRHENGIRCFPHLALKVWPCRPTLPGEFAPRRFRQMHWLFESRFIDFITCWPLWVIAKHISISNCSFDMPLKSIGSNMCFCVILLRVWTLPPTAFMRMESNSTRCSMWQCVSLLVPCTSCFVLFTRWVSLVTTLVVCSKDLLLKNRYRSFDKNSTATDKNCISSSFGFEIQHYIIPNLAWIWQPPFPFHLSLLWKFRILTHFCHGNEAFNYPLLGCNGCCLAKAADECTAMGNCQFYTERRGVSVQVAWCLLTWCFWW